MARLDIIYPPTQQLLRVTAATVAGPAGAAQVAGSSILAPQLHVAFTQQMRDDGSLLPRDREPCLAAAVRGFVLTPGFHMGRLAGSHNGLPVYEVVEVGLSGSSGPMGPAGATGPAGPIGSTGPAGSCGPCGSSAPSLICSLLRELTGFNAGRQQILGHDSSGNCRWYDVEECP